jgi:hypothetical protein
VVAADVAQFLPDVLPLAAPCAAELGSRERMSEPLAAEEDSLRARLGRAEKEGVRLSTEKARVAKLLAPGPTASVWSVGLAVSMVVGGLGFGASWAMASQRATREEQLWQQRLKAELVEEQRKLNECKLTELDAQRALQKCWERSPLGNMPSDPLPGPPPSPCRCQAGDPLCSCL